MNTLKKAIIGTAAATAMAVSATPAMANGYDRDGGGISAGEIIAGAVVIGAIAAIASSGNDNDRYSYNDRYRGDRYDRNYRYGRYMNPRQAVDRCVRATEQRASYYGRANVTRINDVDRTRDGYKIKGRVDVRNGYRRGTDRGKFTCYIDRNRVSDVRLKNLKYRR